MEACAINGTGDSILFLHGALVTKRMWEPQIGPLSANFQVITCDLPGHGGAPDIVGAYTIPRLANYVLETMDAVGIPRTHICGHSLGGMVAQVIAARYPERVDRLVLAETALGTRDTIWERAQTSLARPFLKLISPRYLARVSANQYGSLNPAVGAYIEDEMGRFDQEAILRVMGSAFEFSGKEGLGKITAPTLVLLSEKNRRTHRQGIQIAELIPKASWEIIPDSHHLLNLDNPPAFNKTVLDFLSG